MIDAMENPGGDSDQNLLDVLKEEAGEISSPETGVRFDDNGLYAPAG